MLQELEVETQGLASLFAPNAPARKCKRHPHLTWSFNNEHWEKTASGVNFFYRSPERAPAHLATSRIDANGSNKNLTIPRAAVEYQKNNLTGLPPTKIISEEEFYGETAGTWHFIEAGPEAGNRSVCFPSSAHRFFNLLILTF